MPSVNTGVGVGVGVGEGVGVGDGVGVAVGVGVGVGVGDGVGVRVGVGVGTGVGVGVTVGVGVGGTGVGVKVAVGVGTGGAGVGVDVGGVAHAATMPRNAKAAGASRASRRCIMMSVRDEDLRDHATVYYGNAGLRQGNWTARSAAFSSGAPRDAVAGPTRCGFGLRRTTATSGACYTRLYDPRTTGGFTTSTAP